MILMLPILLSTNAYGGSTCIFGGTPTASGSLNTNNWIQINLIVVLMSFTIAGLVYSLSNLFPTSMREKLKGAAKVESFQGMISIGIILALIALSSVSCNIGNSIAAQSSSLTNIAYQSPMQFSTSYVNYLMFDRGLSLFSDIYAETIKLVISGNIADSLQEQLHSLVITPLLGEGIGIGQDIYGVFFGFSGALTGAFVPLIIVTFGILFTIFLILSMSNSLALTVVVPISIILRSIPFAGPKLRESADTILALAIGFYFILPLAIIMNSYITAWIFTPCAANTLICNPYAYYNAPYSLQQLPISNIFNSNPQSLSGGGPLSSFGLSSAFLSSGFAGSGILGGFEILLQTLVNFPSVIINYSQQTAQYIFEGIVLMGLDLAITLAFAQGLTKALGSASRIVGVGPFWGNV